MPPKVKVTREEIVAAALGITRERGADAINARSIAQALGCSTQPIFSNFATMDEVRLAVAKEAMALYRACMRRECESGEYPYYKASGMAYIRFAREERELFKLLFMCDREKGASLDTSALFGEMQAVVQGNLGLDRGEAELFHLEMWAFVHGIAAMQATAFLDLDRELVSRMLTDAYQGMMKRHGKGDA